MTSATTTQFAARRTRPALLRSGLRILGVTRDVGLLDELFNITRRHSRRVALPIYVCAGLVAAMALRGGAPRMWVVVWLAAIFVIYAIRYTVLGSDQYLRTWSVTERMRLVMLLNVVTGVLQGSSISFAPYLGELERAVFTIQMLGLCVGGAAGQGGYRPTFLSFALPMLVPTCAMWVFGVNAERRWINWAVATLIVLFGVLMLLIGGDILRLLRRSLRIRRQRIRANERLRAALEAARKANRSKSRFLASASHDLRQPIHALTYFGAALAMRPLDPQAKEYVGYMALALQSFSAQLTALLDISKLDAGVVEVSRRATALQPLLERIANEMDAAARDKGITMSVDCAVDIAIDTDALLLERVIRNLVENAVKYTDSGSIRLIANREDQRFVTLELVDSGHGIPADELERVFDEFYQIGNPERDRTRGFGLGLAIVKRLTSLLDIQLTLRSEIGAGTTFALRIPSADGVVATAVGAAASPLDIVGTVVLVIDDERMVRNAMNAILQALGCIPRVASSTEEAVEQMRERRADIVLADFRLRGTDSGIVAIRRLREIEPALPALLVSGDTAPERILEARAAGVELLHKPLGVDELRRAVASAMRRSRESTA